MAHKKTHDEFVFQALEKHKNKYSYPDTYIADSIKININCPLHGLFKQIPSSHLQGCGCPKCAIDYRALLFLKNNDNFIMQAQQIHNNKYAYPDKYQGAHVKININCFIHGLFLQAPDKHLQGNGCPKCAGRVRKTKQKFVDEANIIHNYKYTYPGDYINARTDIEIKCFKHGIFSQNPDVHLNGVGCPTCSTNVSKPETEWLNSLGIPNDNKHRSTRLKIGDSYIKPDGFVPETNTIYEFYGDYWHGNPKTMKPIQINHKNGKTMEVLYKETLDRENLIKSAGYNLVYIWESDWNGYV